MSTEQKLRALAQYEKLVEAVRKDLECYFGSSDHCNARLEIRHTLDDIDGQSDAEIEYEWLAMDADSSAHLFESRPQWINGDEFDYVADTDWRCCEDKPDFLRPGQLWKRGLDDCYVDKSFALERDGFKEWDGYWWRKVEDHDAIAVIDDHFNTLITQQFRENCIKAGMNPWITDRRPTEEDAWRGLVMVICPVMGLAVEKWQCTTDEPWQPIPECLRVVPELQKPDCYGVLFEKLKASTPCTTCIFDDQCALKISDKWGGA